MNSSQKKQNRKNSQIRASVEHCFRVIKCQFGDKKASYKGLVKNAVQVFTLLGLANLYMLRGLLILLDPRLRGDYESGFNQRFLK